MAIAAAACQAVAVAGAAATPAGGLTSLENRLVFCVDLAVLLDGLERPGGTLRGGRGAPSLHGRIGTELPRYLMDEEAPFANWHNGAYVLESLPCALWCFLHSPEDFEQTLFAAVDAGRDADTVAAMACSIAGAYHGYSRLPHRLVTDLEHHDRLLALADGLSELNRRFHMTPDLPTRARYRSRVLPLTEEDLLVVLDSRSGNGPGDGRLVRRSASPCVLAVEVDAREVQGEGEDEYRALADLAGHLVGQGIHLRCCGTCLRLRFSSMSYQMSGGTKGYCALDKEDNPAGRCTQADVVSIWDVCAGFRYGLDRVWDD